MNKLKSMSPATRTNFLTYAAVILTFAILQPLSAAGKISPTLQGQLVPVCAYVVMALSLNLTVGVLGELSLGHAGFMSVGAFSGAVCASALQNVIPASGLRLAVSMVVGAVLAGIVGTIISVPVLRLNGDYLAIVTLAFGQIIKSIVENLYVGVDAKGLHFSFLQPTMRLGEGGRMILNGPMGIPNISKISTFLAGFILIMVTLAVIFNLVNSRSGRAIMALRDNRIAAESVGINVIKYKIMAFVISAALAGAAGALFSLGQNTIVASKFDPGLRGPGRPGEDVGLHPGGLLPHHPARDRRHAGPEGLPDAGLRHRPHPGDAGHQQPGAEGLFRQILPPKGR